MRWSFSQLRHVVSNRYRGSSFRRMGGTLEMSIAERKRLESVRFSIERVSRWMIRRGAPLLVENLAPGASPELLAHAETGFGCALPFDLRALWSLHNGQREQQDGFIETFDLLSVREALVQQETVQRFIEFERESVSTWPSDSGGGTKKELLSNHWLPFAARESDSLVVHGVTGRVFKIGKSVSTRLLAPSLMSWFQIYAMQVENNDYVVEEGFGTYFLSKRDRKAERQEKKREKLRADHDRLRQETPLLDQFRAAMSTPEELGLAPIDRVVASGPPRCTEILKDALQRDDKDAFAAAVAMLFTSNPSPILVAEILRPVLNAVTLAPDQWVDVAVGGALLGNNAVRDVAVRRAMGVSVARMEQLEHARATADGDEREALDGLLQKLRAQPS